jgi:ArsR family transcriptional regulator
MDIIQAATCLEKLGNPLRLEIVRLLVRADHDGLAVGEIQRHLKVPASTLSHHIMLTEECCAGVGATKDRQAG